MLVEVVGVASSNPARVINICPSTLAGKSVVYCTGDRIILVSVLESQLTGDYNYVSVFFCQRIS